METDWKIMADNARLRSNMYGLLAAIFREEPSGALIKELRSPRLSGVLSDLGINLGEVFYNSSEAELTGILGLEFTRLFIGPSDHVSAHESVFTEMDGGMSGGLWGATTVKVKNFIETAGLDYKPEFSGVPDHISVELEFMQKLTESEADKWDRHDPEGAEFCQTVQHKFIEEHLSTWIPQFCDAVLAKAKMPFYQAASELAKNYLEVEQQSITTDATT
ncbi:MAG: molecular chaperone TorD family protein [Gammaproteobacteria bacterium]|nr:molecular chaperone TorD family protein [Gammaproteobacteria bacterium]